MRVLLLHSRYLSGAMSGENRVVEDELRLLRSAGHDAHDLQISVDPSSTGARRGLDAIWSSSARAELRRELGRRRPEVVHVHSLYPRLSPAVLRVVPNEVAVVMTLHNFRLMCLPATFLRDGRICEACLGRAPWRGFRHACYRGSHSASAALGASLVLHRALGSFDRIDRFLAVSRFVAAKHAEAGIAPARIGVKVNFAWDAPRRADVGGPILYLGRISAEKGLATVLEALPNGLELVVAGDGPERDELERRFSRRGGVTFVGEVSSERASQLLSQARALVVPSEWYEAQPRVILEAFASGVPVVASRIGALPELVEDGVNGRLAPVGDAAAWRSVLSELDDDEARRLGDGALSSWRRAFTPEIALARLEEAYGIAVRRRLDPVGR